MGCLWVLPRDIFGFAVMASYTFLLEIKQSRMEDVSVCFTGETYSTIGWKKPGRCNMQPEAD